MAVGCPCTTQTSSICLTLKQAGSESVLRDAFISITPLPHFVSIVLILDKHVIWTEAKAQGRINCNDE